MVSFTRRQSLKLAALGSGEFFVYGCEPTTVAAFTLFAKNTFIFLAKEAGMAIARKVIVVGVDAAWNAVFPTAQAGELNQTTRQLAAYYGLSSVETARIWYQQDRTGIRANSGSFTVKNLSDRNLSAMVYLGLQDLVSGNITNLITRGFTLNPKLETSLAYSVDSLPSPGMKRVIVMKVVSDDNSALHCSSNTVDVCVLPGRIVVDGS